MVLECLSQQLRVHACHQGAAPLSPFTSSKDAGPPESSLPLAFTQQEVQEQGRPMRDASAPGSATSAASLPDQAPSTAERMAAPPPASPVRSPWGSERKVSFAADTAEGPGPPPAAGALSAGLESPKLSSMGMRELRDVMRKMHYTRCSPPTCFALPDVQCVLILGRTRAPVHHVVAFWDVQGSPYCHQ